MNRESCEVDARGGSLSTPVQLGIGAVAAIVLAHFTVDFYAGYTAPLLRYFNHTFGLTQAQTSLLAAPGSLMVMCQPLLGLVSDRMRTRLFVVGGLILASLGYGMVLPLAGLVGAPAGYFMALAGIWMGGVGLACYHPQGAALAGRSKSRRYGGAVAVFVFSGSLGYGLGILAPPRFFPDHIAWILVLGVLGLGALVAQRAVPPLRPAGEALRRPPVMATLRHLRDEVRPVFSVLIVLWILVVLRAATLMAFQQFTSIYYGRAHGFTDSQGAFLVAAFFLSQALSGLWGTHAAGRFGARRVLALTFVLGGLLLGGALTLARIGLPGVSGILLVGGGATLGLSVPVNVAAGQRLLPRSAALASGLMIGFGWGTGGLLVPLVAGVGDLFGSTWAVLATGAALTLPSALLVTLLPKGEESPVEDK